MSDAGGTLTIALTDATAEQLRAELDRANRLAAKFSADGDPWHLWRERASEVEAELRRRRDG